MRAGPIAHVRTPGHVPDDCVAVASKPQVEARSTLERRQYLGMRLVNICVFQKNRRVSSAVERHKPEPEAQAHALRGAKASITRRRSSERIHRYSKGRAKQVVIGELNERYRQQTDDDISITFGRVVAFLEAPPAQSMHCGPQRGAEGLTRASREW